MDEKQYRTQARRASTEVRKNADRRMAGHITALSVIDANLVAIENLSPRLVPHWIGELRKAEAEVRQLRKRLEALQAGLVDDRLCEFCDRPMVGRPDKRFCSTECRVRNHRGAEDMRHSYTHAVADRASRATARSVTEAQ